MVPVSGTFGLAHRWDCCRNSHWGKVEKGRKESSLIKTKH
jgi:hypothetical protein